MNEISPQLAAGYQKKNLIICVEVGACGMRFVCLFLNLTGLDRFVAASYGAQQKVNRQGEGAIGASSQTETPRLAKDMPRKDISLTQDETFPGGLCLVGMESVSTFLILEQLAQAHQLRGLDLSRKRACLTAIHNFFLTRSDGTTAAERFFGQKSRSMFAAIFASVDLPPTPLSPPRKP